jgi:hypothetical protein
MGALRLCRQAWRGAVRSHIIVGAGTAGAIVAARPDYAGEEATPHDLLDSKNIAGTAHDWG